MAQTSSSRAAADSPKSAANFVRRSAEAIRSRDGSITGWKAERRALLEYAEKYGKLLSQDHLSQFSYKGSGAEHRVFHDAEKGRAVKVTHPNRYGHSAYGPGLSATPSEYLRRLAWANGILGDDFRIHGVICEEEHIEIVSSHPWITAHPESPQPSTEEIAAYFKRFDFEPVSVDPSVPLYFNRRSGLLIIDATDLNVIRDRNEYIAAIDVGIGFPGPQILRQIEEYFEPSLPLTESG